MGHLVTLATCSLNQWALDWEGNKDRIVKSIHQAKAVGATLRVGPELEISGYGCLDHFLEADVYLHCWEMLEKILTDESCHGILLDIGMPVAHRNVRYNCRIVCLNGRILFIRPKIFLANDGNYRENRYFTPWSRPKYHEEYYLPRRIRNLMGGTIKVPIGDVLLSTPDTCIGIETCEELFTPDSPHNQMSLNGAEIITNSSGSHHLLRKLDQRIKLVLDATAKNGGIYIYSNQIGMDGDRLYYDGCSMIAVNGEIVAQGSQFSLTDCEVITATVDLEDVRSHRFAPSRGQQAVQSTAYHRIETDFALSDEKAGYIHGKSPGPARQIRYHTPEEEIALGPAIWMWGYLVRSKQAGYLVPLSGGIDSCATAVLVFSMCREVMKAIEAGNKLVLQDVQRLSGEKSDWKPKSAQEFCGRIFHTVYMGMKTQSSAETRKRAKDLAEAIGAYHVEVDIDEVFEAQKKLITTLGFEPKFKVHGGSHQENITLQNIQSRTRMVTAYMFSQIIPTARGGDRGLLVLGSANVDECLRGYLTKYDCSSADINPIGSISKNDLKRFITYATKNFDLPILDEFIHAVPTAELEPITKDYVQSDEADMGFTYDELSDFGILRKQQKCGPYGAFLKLLHNEKWSSKYGPREIALKTKRFFHYYAINRHKMTTMTPAYHAEAYSPDDNRFDLRPFCYPPFWDGWSFKKIDEEVERIERDMGMEEKS
ncbi:glutamine-dependent NAD(+) synthetase with GAT domain-containing protein [Aulographum hederae CBS 113979]|uniref:Glutamine-dependent NAD(+) synthetase n=1 Tax=Aulographum hederae CBS 113979 TaxID=1176131 RepID=A0A6G1HFL9_9PEZI|nr:glutamine-dependent NAD(+) synthetase with GAT domain-containing protein [Aulographum hederae CBS 113979]